MVAPLGIPPIMDQISYGILISIWQLLFELDCAWIRISSGISIFPKYDKIPPPRLFDTRKYVLNFPYFPFFIKMSVRVCGCVDVDVWCVSVWLCEYGCVCACVLVGFQSVGMCVCVCVSVCVCVFVWLCAYMYVFVCGSCHFTCVLSECRGSWSGGVYVPRIKWIMYETIQVLRVNTATQ